MAGFSDYLETALINATLRNTTYTSPATVYVQIYVGDPGDDGLGGTGSGAARSATAFDAPTGGATTNTAAETFASVLAGTYTHIGVWDHISAGNLLYSGALTTPKTVDAGDSITFAIGELDITLT